MCLRDDLTCDFGEVDESVFQGVERPFEPIFRIMGIQKSDLD
jgi:hypothetical protein